MDVEGVTLDITGKQQKIWLVVVVRKGKLLNFHNKNPTECYFDYEKGGHFSQSYSPHFHANYSYIFEYYTTKEGRWRARAYNPFSDDGKPT